VNAHPAWQALQTQITANLPEYLIFASALSIAIVCAMPEKIPSSFQELWTWLRNSLQTAVPAARLNHTQPSNPQQPEGPAQPKVK
jgi:hypothetical protein